MSERKTPKKASRHVGRELRPEYRREDFGPLVRGKYAARVRAGSNVVVLVEEVAKAFPTAAAVNDALLSLIKIARSVKEPRRAGAAASRKRGPRSG